VLRHDVDAALASLFQILQGVFRPIWPTGKSDDEDWRVVVDALEVAERREIFFAIFGDGADETYGSGDDARDEERVVVEHGSSSCERVDFDVFFGQRFASIGCTRTIAPGSRGAFCT
jgi:hypothetical protein